MKRAGNVVEGEQFSGEVTADIDLEGKFGAQVEIAVGDPDGTPIIGWLPLNLDENGDAGDVRKASKAFYILDSVREATGVDYFKQDEGPAEYILAAFSGKEAWGMRYDSMGKASNVMIFKGTGSPDSGDVTVFEDDSAALAYATTVVTGLSKQEAKAAIRKDASLKAAGYKGASLIDTLEVEGRVSEVDGVFSSTN